MLARRGLERGVEAIGELEIEWRPAPFGGARPFWRCPKCGNRREVLYAPRPRRAGSGGLACRVCHRIAYETSAMSRVDRLFARRDAILRRLGIAGGCPRAPAHHLKPKGMRALTFCVLLFRARELEVRAMGLGLATIRGEVSRG